MSLLNAIMQKHLLFFKYLAAYHYANNRNLDLLKLKVAKLLDSCFPEKYVAARETAIKTSFQHAGLSVNEAPNDYSNLIITVKAKFPSMAVHKPYVALIYSEQYGAFYRTH